MRAVEINHSLKIIFKEVSKVFLPHGFWCMDSCDTQTDRHINLLETQGI